MAGIHPWLSKTTKMPGYSFSIPAVACVTGSKLAQVPNSVCSKCYALKGNYNFPNVQRALRKRHEALYQADFVEKMTELLKRVKCKYFRWFDSGDIPTFDTIEKLVQIAWNLPDMHFWLPTKEHRWVRDYFAVHAKPPNLIIRLSSYVIGGRPVKTTFLTSTTHRKKDVPHGFECPAPKQDGRCGECRQCWNPGTANISYQMH